MALEGIGHRLGLQLILEPISLGSLVKDLLPIFRKDLVCLQIHECLPIKLFGQDLRLEGAW